MNALDRGVSFFGQLCQDSLRDQEAVVLKRIGFHHNTTSNAVLRYAVHPNIIGIQNHVDFVADPCCEADTFCLYGRGGDGFDHLDCRVFQQLSHDVPSCFFVAPAENVRATVGTSIGPFSVKSLDRDGTNKFSVRNRTDAARVGTYTNELPVCRTIGELHPKSRMDFGEYFPSHQTVINIFIDLPGLFARRLRAKLYPAALRVAATMSCFSTRTAGASA